jgi:CheY-like chemotaxis protein
MGLIDRLRRKPEWPRLSHEEIVKRTRVLVIDDSEFPYQRLFKRDGYNIEKWADVRDLPALERGDYDVILLDLHGVGRSLSADQGLGVLAHLDDVNPTQIIIAYSNAEWSVEYQEFFSSADAVLHKTKDDYVVFKRTVDELLDSRFSLGFYVGRIERELADVAVSGQVVEKARRAMASGRTDGFKRYLRGHVDDPRTVDRVLAIIQVAIGVAQLWKS